MTKDDHQLVVEKFLNVQSLVMRKGTVFKRDLEAGRMEELEGLDWKTKIEVKERLRSSVMNLLPAMRDAHIFEMPNASAHILVNTAIDIGTKKIKEAEKKEYKKLNSWNFKNAPLEKAILDGIPYPEKLPFPSCFFAWPGKINFDKHRDKDRIRFTGPISLYGYLVSESLAIEILAIDNSPEGLRVFPNPTYINGRWEPMAFDAYGPWVITALLALVENNRPSISERARGLSDRLAWEKFRKQHRAPLAPASFYTIDMADGEIVGRATRRALRKIEWTHRWEVMAHDAVKIRRGSLPLDPLLERRLLRRRYRIFKEGEDIDVDTARVLSRRPRILARATGEWMAVLVSNRRSYVKGPEGKPLVSAARRVA